MPAEIPFIAVRGFFCQLLVYTAISLINPLFAIFRVFMPFTSLDNNRKFFSKTVINIVKMSKSMKVTFY